MSLLSPLLCSVNYSTVTDLAKFLGKSTYKTESSLVKQFTCDEKKKCTLTQK